MKKRSNLSRLLAYAGGHRKLTVLGCVLSGAAAVLGLVPYVCVWLVARQALAVFPAVTEAEGLARWGWMAVWFAVANIALYFAALMCTHIAAFRTARNMRHAGVAHLMELPLGFFTGNRSGELRKIIDDNAALTEDLLAHKLPDLTAAVVTPLAAIVLLFVFDWRMGLLCLLTMVLALGCMMAMMGGRNAGFFHRYQHQTHIIRTHFQSVKGSDYCFSLTATKAPISATGCGAGQPPNREVPGRRKQPHKRKKGGRSRVTVRPPFLSSLCLALLSLRFPLLLPFSKFPLAFLALVESKDVRHDTAGYCLDLVLGDVGIVDQLFPSSQIYLRVSQDFVTAGGPCPSFAAAAAPSTPAAPPGVCSGQTAGAVHSPFAAQAPPSACVCSFHC